MKAGQFSLKTIVVDQDMNIYSIKSVRKHILSKITQLLHDHNCNINSFKQFRAHFPHSTITHINIQIGLHTIHICEHKHAIQW